MSSRHFDLVSHWCIHAPVAPVWAALTTPESWPQWWPGVRAVQTLRPGGADGLGSLRRMTWATRLPYDVVVEIEAVEAIPHERLRGRSRGQMNGEGIWLLREERNGQQAVTHVTYVWRVELSQRWMRWLAPLLAPLFRWNHRAVMKAGGDALNARLQRNALSASAMARR
jgi:uncharacterized protein YndB with AHSA1/START domain